MCRLAAFPPKFPKTKALEILSYMLDTNKDGTGEVHLENGQFVVNKWPKNLEKVLADDESGFLSHMPHDGWTIVHLRLASHGDNVLENTHPFLKGDYAIVHNGIWSDYFIVREALGKYVDFEGDTDTEVAAQLFANVGPKRFYQVIDSGVWLALNKNGELWAINAGGDLMARTMYGQVVLASELDGEKAKDLGNRRGWIHLASNGAPIGSQLKIVHQKTPWWDMDLPAFDADDRDMPPADYPGCRIISRRSQK